MPAEDNNLKHYRENEALEQHSQHCVVFAGQGCGELQSQAKSLSGSSITCSTLLPSYGLKHGNLCLPG